jgi:signal transduction histidine kinase
MRPTMGQFESIGRISGEIVASMAHDLRSPLNSIIGFSSLLREHKVDPASPEHDEFLDHVLTSARELLQLINDLIDFSVVELARRIVEAQGGRAGAASVAGKGTTTLFAVLPKYHQG